MAANGEISIGGQNITLRCNVQLSPRHELETHLFPISWIRHSSRHRLPAGARLFDNGRELRFWPAKASHSGVYICRVLVIEELGELVFHTSGRFHLKIIEGKF